MGVRTTAKAALLLASIALLGGCAGESQRPRRGELDYCDCAMWGVVGADPGPGYRPPPRPRRCDWILKRRPAADCPIPP